MGRIKAEIRYDNMTEGIFLSRNNRFTAQVMVGGREETVHVKNTGRLGELLLPKARVALQKVEEEGRKTDYDLISVYKQGLGWVNIDSLAPNQLLKLWYRELGCFDLVKPEYVYGDSRIDIYAERGGEKYLDEVKGCTLAHPREKGVGLFPDAPTERGVKHLRELAGAAGEGYICFISFVIQMNGVHLVFPNTQTHPAFRDALAEAAKAGVVVRYFSCHVESDSIRITNVVNDTDRYLRM